ncbi:hypothetical protein H0H81_004347 [Sphagnurus paluster]|uniref:non-specific serine/threonine protein kinase n=1 Tax=Sphagnurus paluster TaxID=117069 RepID=A0A9P7KJG4_9AGAR|nr:hypothetical protein H0H81_004347 [Sphagnurus paluster]
MADLSFPMISRKRTKDPRRIGLWKMGRDLGQGASGRVRIARHSETGQYAAVKIISKASFNSHVSLNRIADETERRKLAIEREIVVMKLLDHPNLMRLYDVWETSSDLYLILEYVQGGELFEHIINKGPLPVPEALNYFQQIVTAVDCCHRFNIAHRDLKPENILLDHALNIKIADFGYAAWQAYDDTLLQTSCGSPHYAAPEIFLGQSYNGSVSDIWSCGVILFALLAGRCPFDHEDTGALGEIIKSGKYEMPSDIDPLAQDLIKRMLTVDVTQRITMTDIMVHPFYTLHPPKLSAVPPPYDISTGPSPIGSIDPDLFADLKALWYGTTDEDIIESLTNDEVTLQKRIYHRLYEYRERHLKTTYWQEEEKIRQLLERKRSKKAMALAVEREGQQNKLPFPPRDDPPTPRRASGRRGPSAAFSDSSLSCSASPSPLVPSIGEPLPPLLVPDVQDDKMQVFLQQVVQHITILQAKTEYDRWSPNMNVMADFLSGSDQTDTNLPLFSTTPGYKSPLDVVQESLPVTSNGLGIGTKPLSVKGKPRRTTRRSTFDTNKENMGDEDYLMIDEGGSIMKRSSLKRGKGRRAGLGEKRVQIIEPSIKERSKLVKKLKPSRSPAFSDESSLGFPSPTPFSLPPFSSSPKRTWLGNVFSSRPQSINLLSICDVQTTRNECRRLLMAMDVRVVLENPQSLGVLKCRLHEVKEPTGVMNMLKAVKFKVEFQAPEICDQAEDGEEVVMMSLAIIYEKGSVETFKEVCRRLQREWVMDGTAPVTPLLGAGQSVDVYT